jgi:UDP-glucose 4-epimerase
MACPIRYFNAAGVDPDGECGEDHDPETHIIPRALMAAAGELDRIDIFGTAWDWFRKHCSAAGLNNGFALGRHHVRSV